MKNSFIKNYTNNKVTGSILTICLLILLVGFSYAFFVYNKTGLYTHTITGGRLSIIYNETTGNNITINNAYPLRDEEAETKALEFEFTITGYNESDKNIYYAIEMDYGEDVSDKERFKDSDLKLSLYENNKKIFENEIFNNLDNNDIYYGYIDQGTNSTTPTINNYKLRIWINDDVLITDTPDMVDTTDKSVYSTSEFANSYASYKVNIKADLTYDDVGFITYDANGGSYTPEKTSLTTNKITLEKPVKDGKGFLGWSSSPNGKIEYYSGDNYSGEGKILYAIYGDTRNVMVGLEEFPESFGEVLAGAYESQIVINMAFINETEDNIDIRAEALGQKWDLTKDNCGKVTAWMELDDDGETPIIYIGSEGATYLSSGEYLFTFSSANKIDFTNVDTSMVTNMTSMFGSVYDSLNDEYLYGATMLENLDLSSFNTSNVTDMSYMFTNCLKLSSLDVSNFNTSQVTNMSYMFGASIIGNENHSILENLDVSSFDTSKLSDMSCMFAGLRNLKSLDLSKFNTSNVTNMKNLFYACESLELLNVSSFNTSKVTDMSFMFMGCLLLEEISVSNFDTKNVKMMTSMFYICQNLVTLDVSNWDTSNVTDMQGMFLGCYNLDNLEINDWNTSNVENMSRMFYECTVNKKVNLSKWNTSNVTDMSYMFFYSNILDDIVDLSNWNVSQVTNMFSMFEQFLVQKIDLSNWNATNVLDMSRMFTRSTKLNSINLSNWNTSSVKNMDAMFSGCVYLTELNLDSFNTNQVVSMKQMFSNCNSLNRLDLSSFDTSSLKEISDMDSQATDMLYFGMFDNCSNLTYLDISSFDFSKFDDYQGAFYNMNANARIYVKDATSQSLILGIDTLYRPNWTNQNVLVKTV